MGARPACVLSVVLLVGCGGGGGGPLHLPSPPPEEFVPPENQHVPHRVLFLGETTELYTTAQLFNREGHGYAGQTIDHLQSEELGPWASKDNLVAYATEYYRWGIVPVITRHNGKYRGFVVGPEPPSFEDLTFTHNTYTYSGGLLGVDQEGDRVEGTVDLVAKLSNLHVTLNIRDLAYAAGGAFLDGDLFYDLAIYGNTFRSFNRQGNDPGRVSGSFFGADVDRTNHVGGVVLHPDMTAVFVGEQTSHSSDPSTP